MPQSSRFESVIQLTFLWPNRRARSNGARASAYSRMPARTAALPRPWSSVARGEQLTAKGVGFAICRGLNYLRLLKRRLET
jgi:hypothetical protein